MWFIVARSEFLRRVRSKMFLVSTLLVPLLIVGFGVAGGAMAVAAMETGTHNVGVVDSTGRVVTRFAQTERFNVSTFPSEADVRQRLDDGRLDAYVVIPANVLDTTAVVRYVATRGAGLITQEQLRSEVNDAVRQLRLDAAGLSPEAQQLLKRTPRWEASERSGEGETASRAVAGAALGFGMGFVIYLVMLLYGQMVMMGVMEEKQHRVLEVMASSVRPFDLLMGKVLGIGAVGLVQMAVWLGAVATLGLFAGGIAGLFIDPASLNLPTGTSGDELLAASGVTMPSIGPGLVVAFLAFFLGGYLLYASLFAAVGSAVEQQQDAQSLLLPLMMPVVLSFVALQAVLTNPDGPVAQALSLVPFFSPILMPARMAATDVPAWEVIVSLALLVAAFLGAIWLSARIYRVGILSYGKKPTLRDLARWVRTA
ncbi:MAG: ABC transporter permease [Rhodothermales bacterium]|nr:ABC transporter permease [Rhodothermales bacterium]MCA0269162.1 ABC transporter permease [Bacteroidota bacterium]